MFQNAANFSAIPLEAINLSGPVADTYNLFKERTDAGDLPHSAKNKQPFKRWQVLFGELEGMGSVLDFGTGLGQLANAAAHSGAFSRVIAADRKLHSQFQAADQIEAVEFNVIDPPNPQYRADVVVCQMTLPKLTPASSKHAIQNLQFLALRKLVLALPYCQSPLPEGIKQTFNTTRLLEYFPTGKFTFLTIGAQIPWVMVTVDMS